MQWQKSTSNFTISGKFSFYLNIYTNYALCTAIEHKICAAQGKEQAVPDGAAFCIYADVYSQSVTQGEQTANIVTPEIENRDRE